MNNTQDRIVLAATLMAESAWLYALARVSGVVFSVDGSPLGWLGVLAILGTSLLLARMLSLVHLSTKWSYIIQMIVGVLALYLIMGTQVASPDYWLDLEWIVKLASGTEIDGYTRGATIGSLLLVMFWLRGGRMASADYPVEGLESSFKLGTLVMAMATIVDILGSSSLNIFPVMFLFFASSLVGLGVGHVLPVSQKSIEDKTWPKIIGGVAALVVVGGFLFSLLQNGVLPVMSVALSFVLTGLITGIFYVVVPIALAFGWLVENLFALLPANDDTWGGFGKRVGARSAEIEQGLVQATQESGETAFVQVMEWVLIVFIVLVALFLLAVAFRRWSRVRLIQAEGSRESVREDSDPILDMKKLLFNLVPQSFRKGDRRKLDLPEDDANIVEVFQIYFGLLTKAEDKGHYRSPSQTPEEYQGILEQIFPSTLVREATTAFVRACYGHHPLSQQQIDQIRVSVDKLD